MCANNAEPSNTGNSTKQPIASLSRSRVEVRGRLEQYSHPLTGLFALYYCYQGKVGIYTQVKLKITLAYHYIFLLLQFFYIIDICIHVKISPNCFYNDRKCCKCTLYLWPDFLYKLIYGRAFPEILAPEKKMPF